MFSMDELVLKASKEIVVKFIEASRIPSGLHDAFNLICQTVSGAAAGEAG